MSDLLDSTNYSVRSSSFLARVIADALRPLVANAQAPQTIQATQTNSSADNFSPDFFAADTPQVQRAQVNSEQQIKTTKPENLAPENDLPRTEAEAKPPRHLIAKPSLNQSPVTRIAKPKSEQDVAAGFSKATSAVRVEQSGRVDQPALTAPQTIAEKMAATRHLAREPKPSPNTAPPALIIRARAPAAARDQSSSSMAATTDSSQDLAQPQKPKIATPKIVTPKIVTPKTADTGVKQVEQSLNQTVKNTTANSLQAAAKPYVSETNALARAQPLQPAHAPAAASAGLHIGQVILRVEDSAAAPKHTAAKAKTGQAQSRVQADAESRQFLRTL